jgi:hypothetical protein
MWAWPTATFFFSLRRGLRTADFGAAIYEILWLHLVEV